MQGVISRDLEQHGIVNVRSVQWNLPAASLYEEAVRRSEGLIEQANQQLAGQRHFVGENQPRGASISYFLKTPVTGEVKITIADATGRVVRALDGTRTAGINRVQWNLSPTPASGAGGGGGGGGGGFAAPPVVEPGTYVVTLSVNGRTISKSLAVLEDRWLGER